MVEHARREYPLECCGLLSGSGWAIDGIQTTGNQRQSRSEFSIPVEELFAFFRGLRRSGKEHLGIYHSHPTSRSLPSSRDVAEFHYPEVSYWIVSLQGEEPDVRCFRWDKREFKNVDFEVYEDHGKRPQQCKMKSVQTIPREPDIFANIRDSAPVELLGFLDQIVLLLPEGSRYRLKQVFDSLPPQGDNLQKVLELVRSQWKDIQSQEWVQIAIVGPGQTGKSSLLAALSRRQVAGSKPIFTLVDIHDEYLGFKPDETLSEKLQEVDLILLILDGRYELSKSTKEMYERLNSLNRPVLVVLNKIDLVQTPRDAVRAARRRLGTSVFATSVVQPETIEQLLKAILDTDPKTLSSLTQNFPDFRRSMGHGIVSQAALSGAIVGAIPIPIADFLPITAIQTGMLLKIARTFGYSLNRERARELLPMLAAGVAAREGSHWLRRRYPEYRKLISISVAGIWTFVLGHAAIQYFEGLSHFLSDDRSTDFPSPAMGWEIH